MPEMEANIQIFHQSRGRLGNQLFQYAAIQGIAARNNATICLAPQYYWFSPYETKQSKAHFEEFKASFSGHGLSQPCTRRSNAQTVSGDGQYIFQSPRIRHSMEIDGDMESFRFFSPQLRTRLFFNSVIWHNATRYLSRFKGKLRIGIHMRYYEGDSMKVSNGLYFLRAIAFFKSRYKDIQFVLASDNIDSCAKTEYFIRPDLHLVREKNVPALDMAILAQCDHIILSTGTFGWWAAFLGPDNKNGTVVYDKDGMGTWGDPVHFKYYTSADYFPPHWIGL
jgi:galactoside 2-L-fucosyltransferase 1/2